MAVTQIRGNVQIKAASVTETELATSVAGNGISGGGGTALAIDFNELSEAVVDVANDFITIEDQGDGSSKKESVADLITAVAGNGLGATSGVLAVNVDDSTVEINADTLRVKADGITGAQIADDQIDSEHYVADSIDAEHYAPDSVDKDAINADIAGDGLSQAAGGELDVNVDDSTIETNTDTLRVKALGITNNELALGSVDVDNLSDLRVTEGTALNADFAAGTLRNDNAIVSIAASTVAVADDDVSFVEVDSAGAVTSNTTGFTTGRIALAEVTAASGDITAVADKRAWLDVEIGASGLTNADFVDREVVAFDFDGADTTGVLANTPLAGSEHVYLNGILQEDGATEDYQISGSTITFNAAPVSGDFVSVSYRK